MNYDTQPIADLMDKSINALEKTLTLRQSIPRLNQIALKHDLTLSNTKHFRLAISIMNNEV